MNTIVADLTPIRILMDEPLTNYTFTKTGGAVDYLIFPKTRGEVKEVVDYANAHQIPWTVIGNASNLIVKDGGIRGFVIMLTDLNTISLSDTTIYADAGAKLIAVSKFAGEKSLTGLEFACGIPGSMGGALFMNAGAYGGEMAKVVASVDVLTPRGEFRTYHKDDLNFAYRYSLLQESGDIVLGGTLLLKAGDPVKINEQMQELTEARQSKQPLEYPSCGSVFQRPKNHYTGPLIQEAGLQGLIWGGAQISEKHAGFIVNINHATATDYLELIAHIQKVVYEKFGVRLETEVRILGEDK